MNSKKKKNQVIHLISNLLNQKLWFKIRVSLSPANFSKSPVTVLIKLIKPLDLHYIVW